MPTILFASPIFGPVVSRRLGISLGVNLLPADGKLCNSTAFIASVDLMKSVAQIPVCRAKRSS